MRRRLIALGALAFGCGDADAPSAADPDPAPPAAVAPAVDTEQEPEAKPCGAVLNVGPEWVDLVSQQAARWTAAAGCTVTFGPEGAPVSFHANMTDPDGDPVFGKTVISTLDGKFERCVSIDVSLESDDLGRTVGHELGHCLGARGHTDDGIMREYLQPGESAALDAEALGLLCSSVMCTKFEPEAVARPE